MLQATLYPGLGTLRIVDQLSIHSPFQSLRIAECADRERWRGQVKKRDQLTNARGCGSHRADGDVDALRRPNAPFRDTRKRVVERARILQRMSNRVRGGVPRHRRRLPAETEGNPRARLLQAAKASLLARDRSPASENFLRARLGYVDFPSDMQHASRRVAYQRYRTARSQGLPRL